MTTTVVSDILRDTVVVAIKIAGPMLLLSMLVGVLIAIFQAVTQIHEQTLTFVPKLLVISLMLFVTGTWMISTMTEFVQYLFSVMLLI